MHAIGAAHRGEGTNATGKAAGQLLNFTDLALLPVDLGNRHTKGGSGVDLVHVLTFGKDGQLTLACGAVGKPRCGAGFDGCPIGHD